VSRAGAYIRAGKGEEPDENLVFIRNLARGGWGGAKDLSGSARTKGKKKGGKKKIFGTGALHLEAKKEGAFPRKIK